MAIRRRKSLGCWLEKLINAFQFSICNHVANDNFLGQFIKSGWWRECLNIASSMKKIKPERRSFNSSVKQMACLTDLVFPIYKKVRE